MLVSTHLSHLLRQLAQNPSAGWVLATVVSKFRSSYRQPGAMMLIDPDGQSFGLVSGGCLEADIRRNARKVLALDQPKTVLYDSADEDSVAAELGLGCNGRVEILIQVLKQAQLDVLLQLQHRMDSGLDTYLAQCFESEDRDDLNSLVLMDQQGKILTSASSVTPPSQEVDAVSQHQIISVNKRSWSVNRHNHPVSLWIIGGGEDAQPLTKIAASLGWKLTLVDHRPAFARQQNFPDVARFLRIKANQIDESIDADALVIMSHSLEMDAAWLGQCQQAQNLAYIGLLGPVERKAEVLQLAGIEQSAPICSKIYGPMGFDIGGDMPESVALSTLAQCHQVLFKGQLRRSHD